MTRRFFNTVGPCVLLMSVASIAARGNVVVIDSFEDRPAGYPVMVAFGDAVNAMQSYPNVIGGRGISIYGDTPQVTLPNGEGGSVEATVVDINNATGSSFLEFNSDPNASTTLEIGYGGTSDFDPQPTPLGLNVNPATDFLQLAFLAYNNVNSQDLMVGAFLNTEFNPLQSPTSTPVSATLVGSGAQSLDFPLSNLGGNTLDFVTFNFQPPPGTSFELASVELITSVPEPASMALLAFGSLGLLSRWRRSR
jgi:PEP-CTERM motif